MPRECFYGLLDEIGPRITLSSPPRKETTPDTLLLNMTTCTFDVASNIVRSVIFVIIFE